MEIDNAIKIFLSFPRKRESRTTFTWIPDSAWGGSGMTVTRDAWQVMRTVCILFLLLSLNSFGLDAPERAFIWNEANAIMQNAKTPSEYVRAAQTYQRLIDAGVHNGTLFYNIGTALLMADRNELAVDAFERAERYLGRQPDLERNLRIASAKKANNRNPELAWYRMAVFWHFYLSCPQRIYIAVYAFLAFWLALVLRKAGIKRTTNAIALFSLVVFIVFATSAAASWQMEAPARRYNLIIPSPSVTINASTNATTVQRY